MVYSPFSGFPSISSGVRWCVNSASSLVENTCTVAKHTIGGLVSAAESVAEYAVDSVVEYTIDGLVAVDGLPSAVGSVADCAVNGLLSAAGSVAERATSCLARVTVLGARVIPSCSWTEAPRERARQFLVAKLPTITEDQIDSCVNKFIQAGNVEYSENLNFINKIQAFFGKVIYYVLLFLKEKIFRRDIEKLFFNSIKHIVDGNQLKWLIWNGIKKYQLEPDHSKLMDDPAFECRLHTMQHKLEGSDLIKDLSLQMRLVLKFLLPSIFSVKYIDEQIKQLQEQVNAAGLEDLLKFTSDKEKKGFYRGLIISFVESAIEGIAQGQSNNLTESEKVDFNNDIIRFVGQLQNRINLNAEIFEKYVSNSKTEAAASVLEQDFPSLKNEAFILEEDANIDLFFNGSGLEENVPILAEINPPVVEENNYKTNFFDSAKAVFLSVAMKSIKSKDLSELFLRFIDPEKTIGAYQQWLAESYEHYVVEYENRPLA